ncbi:hypothetical protein [Canibacter oris]|uniref:Peptidylprolyl isomerase n=1 Tax=Canibacter oris TaxID=1365628 RepID=A0A840DJG6_9MICO|nr:hypothetical protein [Canibacter oris]MBB4071885.1 peptidylprolyl isomerase [Canibacter oris]
MSVNRKLFATIVAGCAAMLLSGCTGAADTAAPHRDDCRPVLTAGAASAELPATWDKFPSQLTPVTAATVAASQRSVTLAPHSTTPATPGDFVASQLAIYDGKTGEQVYSTTAKGETAQDFLAVQEPEQATALSRAIQCAAAGDQVRVVYSAADSEPFAAQFGISAGSNAVVLLDVAAVSGAKAEGKPQRLPAGFPAITRTADGVPGIVVPPQAPPTETLAAVSIKGTGRMITPADNLVVRYTTVAWEDQEVITSNWTANANPQLLAADAPDIPWRDKLNDIPLGSQVVVLQPASAGAGAAVIVVDLLLAG